VNGQYGVGDSKYVVICDAPLLGHVTPSICIAPKTLCNGEANQQTALNCHRWQPPECCKVNKQYGVGDSKYVVIRDEPTLGHVIRRMRIAPKMLYNGEAHQHTTLIGTAAPRKLHSKWAIWGRGFQICGYCDVPPLGHVTRSICIAPKTLCNGEANQHTALFCHR